MSDAISVVTTYVGVFDGLHTYEVREELTKELIGYNRSSFAPCPGPGWSLDESGGEWVEDAV